MGLLLPTDMWGCYQPVASCSCITYVKLSTNKNRQIAVGNSQSTNPLVPSAPMGTPSSSADTSGVRFLGFFKGYTDIPNVNAKVTLELLQLAALTFQTDCMLPLWPEGRGGPSAVLQLL